MLNFTSNVQYDYMEYSLRQFSASDEYLVWNEKSFIYLLITIKMKKVSRKQEHDINFINPIIENLNNIITVMKQLEKICRREI